MEVEVFPLILFTYVRGGHFRKSTEKMLAQRIQAAELNDIVVVGLPPSRRHKLADLGTQYHFRDLRSALLQLGSHQVLCQIDILDGTVSTRRRNDDRLRR